jgi:ferredoxin
VADYRYLLQEIPAVPAKFSKKAKKPKEMAVVREANCTGCEACVDFCPVNCIDSGVRTSSNVPIPPVRIRWDECIGCKICARVCERLAWNAIDMIPLDQFETEFGVKVSDKYPGLTDPEPLMYSEDPTQNQRTPGNI